MSSKAAFDILASGLRITAQLIDTRDNSHVWADRFDRKVEDVFDIQDEITKDVVAALQVGLTDGEEAHVWARGTSDLEAWQNCVLAIEHQHRLTPTHHLKAREFAERAVKADPDYAYAWSVLGFSYFREARLDVLGDRLARLQRTAEIAEKAMQLDGSVSWVIGLNALVRASLGEHEKAVALAKRSIEMHPGNADIRAYAALTFAFDSRFEDAIEQVGIATSLNPHAPLWYRTSLVRSLALSGACEEAIRVGQEILRSEPDHFPARFFLTYAQQQLGREEDARASCCCAPSICSALSNQPYRRLLDDAKLRTHPTSGRDLPASRFAGC